MNGKLSLYGSMGALVVTIYAMIGIYGGRCTLLFDLDTYNPCSNCLSLV